MLLIELAFELMLASALAYTLQSKIGFHTPMRDVLLL